MTTNGACVCAVGYYQTAQASADNPPACSACPAGSTTTAPDSQGIEWLW